MWWLNDRPVLADLRHRSMGEQVDMPHGVFVSGLEADGGDRFFCGGERAGR